MNPDSRLLTTRRSLHGVAELVLAGPQHAYTGEISLRSVPGGFATTHTPSLSVVGTEVLGLAGAVGINGHTPASLASALGLEATSLSAVYSDGSGVGRDERLEVDAAAAATIADAFAAGDAALLPAGAWPLPGSVRRRCGGAVPGGDAVRRGSLRSAR